VTIEADSLVFDRSWPRRTGVFGGTFDPLHNGHLMIALEVRAALSLDRMLFVVANDPWQKADQPVTSAATRFALVAEAVERVNARLGEEALEASDLEIQRGGETYSADTLEELRSFGEDDLFLVVGSDAAAGLDSWSRPEVIRDLATTVVVERGGRVGGRPPADWDHVVVPVPAMEVSSSDLRARFADGRPVEALMPPTVIDGVRRLGLYESAQ
jgi:nicotinate-nucleotide adenylyltransferase